MRAAYVIPSFGLVLLVVVVLSFSDGLTSDGVPTSDGASTGEHVLVAERLTPPQAEPQAAPQPAEPPPGLVCIQSALGGVRAFAGVSSLRIIADTKPVATSGMRPIPGRQEINVVFPDRYKRAHVGHPPTPLSSTTGFDGDAILSGLGPADAMRSLRTPDAMRNARLQFMREMLMRLPRALPGVTLTQRVASDGGRERLAIDVSGPDRFQATLLADPNTCVPVALQYAMNRLDRMIVRTELSEYRAFGGIRFPTMLKTSHGGIPYTEERVSRVEVNAPGADQYFASAR